MTSEKHVEKRRGIKIPTDVPQCYTQKINQCSIPFSALNACLLVQNSSETTSHTSCRSTNPFFKASTAVPAIRFNQQTIIPLLESRLQAKGGRGVGGIHTVGLNSNVHLRLRRVRNGISAKLNIGAAENSQYMTACIGARTTTLTFS